MQDVPVWEPQVGTYLPLGSVVKERYIVEDLLGKGGFGAVYLVRDSRVKGNLFALKEVVDPDRKDRNRFIFESEVLKRLEHPALPRVYRVFDDDKHQRAYMLMDYIEGQNLEMLRQQQPGKCFPLAQVFTLMTPVMEAVSYLHKQEPPILYRDIKPSNIIGPSTGEGSVLVDFGIAKEYTADTTTTAIRRCSPGYAAPEQYGIGTNTRTDIYGLGATFYTLLTGTVPADALYRITELNSQRVDPLIPVHKLAPEIPPHIAMTIHRAMSLNIDDRFLTVEHFWQTLQGQPAWQQYTVPVPVPPSSNTPNPPTPLPVGNQKGAEPSTLILPALFSNQGEAENNRRSIKSGLLLLALLAILVALGIGPSLWPNTEDHPVARSFLQTPQRPITATPRIHLTGKPTVPSSKNNPAKTHKPTSGQKNNSPSQPVVVSGPPPAAVPTAIPTSYPTTVPVSYPTPQPTVIVTPRPTPLRPTPTPFTNPNVAGNYTGTIDDTTENIVTGMALSIVQQQGQQAISGYFHVDPALLGSNNFTGSINAKKYIQFTVQSYNGNAPLYFWGWVQSNGSMKGSYCSINKSNQCDATAGDAGTWNVSPPVSSSFIPLSLRLGMLLNNGDIPGSGALFLILLLAVILGLLSLLALRLLAPGLRSRRKAKR